MSGRKGKSAKFGGKGGDAGAVTKKLRFKDMLPSLPTVSSTMLPDRDRKDLSGIPTVLKYLILGLICLLAFCIRLFAVVRYESVIHEFDPYFNFRTTKYLAHEGFTEFMNWFDDRGWFPLGRTIGGTIYPGLMLTAALFYWFLNFFYITVNIRNVCVFLAPVFSSFAAVSSYLLTEEVTHRSSTGLLAAAFTAIVPSYISRSVGGSYDNEGVAIFALIFTFYVWIKAVNTGSLAWACATALSYYYMVAAWGGYVFIINVIPIYTLIMIAAGRYSSRLYIAYSCFYTLGSLMAMTVPFVGFNVINQAESAGAHGVFIAIQVYAVVSYLMGIVGVEKLKKLLTTLAFVIVGIFAFLLIALQLSGKLQWSGRSLTLLDPTYASKYIPIIASVSEHQPTTWTSFFFDLHVLVPLAPVGLFFMFKNVTDGTIFIILYGTIAWYFAGVMVRLMLTLAPIACILAAIGFSSILHKYAGIAKDGKIVEILYASIVGKPKPTEPSSTGSVSPAKGGEEKGGVAGKVTKGKHGDEGVSGSDSSIITIAMLVLAGLAYVLLKFSFHSTYVASVAYSSPSIVIDAGQNPQTGQRILWDDYREAYFWLRQNTHEESKILSWWDYGYQMSAMANRTVLVDNNTWNNTHIATVGRALASTEEEAYPILESLDVDYVLVIFGGLTGYSSDDINKFLWPVRIGSGVYPNDMPGERDFYSSAGQFDIGPNGSPTLHNCVAYKLCYYRFGEIHTKYGMPPGFDLARQQEVGVKDIKLTTMEEAFTSEHWIVRIFKVKKRPVLESQSRRPFSSAPVSEEQQEMAEEIVSDEPTYVGCFTSEKYFQNKEYDGGATGANLNLALHFARSSGKKYFAVARTNTDGHAFAFDRILGPSPDGDTTGGGCERPCMDRPEFPCGCSDAECTGPVPAREVHNRRWSVFSVE